MENDQNKLLADVANYYSEKISEHGDTARGVDWNAEESQILRFEQLLKLADTYQESSIIDLGCGYGALYDYLSIKTSNFTYVGYDISAAMISAAQLRSRNEKAAQFHIGSVPVTAADFAVASGIFNVRLGHSEEKWRQFLQSTLEVLDGSSRKGFAFNCLTSYADSEKKRDDLYYADPCALFDLCKKRYSRNVALLHDYSLYEFTILVKKTYDLGDL